MSGSSTESDVARKPRIFKSYVEGKVVLPDGPLDALKILLSVLPKFFEGEIPLQFDSRSLLIRMTDRSSMLIADYVIPATIFKSFHLGFGTRLRPANLPVRFSVDMDDVLSALKWASGAAAIIFDFRLVFVHLGKLERVKLSKPTACPQCRLGIKDTNNRREANKRGKHGNLYTCINCGWSGKVRWRYKNVRAFETKIKLDDSNVSVIVQSNVTESYPIKLRESVPETTPLPAVNFSTRGRLVSRELYRKLQKLRHVNDRFAITGSNDGIVVEGISADVAQYNERHCAKITMPKDSEILIDAEGQEPQRATYSLDYFGRLIGTIRRVADFVELEWSANQPMKITFQVNCLAGATLRYFLAPVSD